MTVPGDVDTIIILDRMKHTASEIMHGEQAGFRQARWCADPTAILHILVEQSIRWNSSLFANIVDYENNMQVWTGIVLEGIET